MKRTNESHGASPMGLTPGSKAWSLTQLAFCEVAAMALWFSASAVNLDLVPTEKVIDLVRERFPEVPMVSFKYQENIDHEELMQIAQSRVDKGHLAVVANRGEETGENGE